MYTGNGNGTATGRCTAIVNQKGGKWDWFKAALWNCLRDG